MKIINKHVVFFLTGIAIVSTSFLSVGISFAQSQPANGRMKLVPCGYQYPAVMINNFYDLPNRERALTNIFSGELWIVGYANLTDEKVADIAAKVVLVNDTINIHFYNKGVDSSVLIEFDCLPGNLAYLDESPAEHLKWHEKIKEIVDNIIGVKEAYAQAPVGLYRAMVIAQSQPPPKPVTGGQPPSPEPQEPTSSTGSFQDPFLNCQWSWQSNSTSFGSGNDAGTSTDVMFQKCGDSWFERHLFLGYHSISYDDGGPGSSGGSMGLRWGF